MSIDFISNNVKNILICSDPIMTKEKEQFSNRRWLRDVLDRPIFVSTGIRPKGFMSSLTQESAFQRKHFFALSNIELDISETQFYFDKEMINEASISYLSSFIGNDCLVIGYELSEQTRSIFDRLKIPYIDIWLHPIRYLDDILFAFGSNVKEVHNLLNKQAIDEYTFRLYADRIKVMDYKGWRREELKLPPNSALFVGQMLNDKSVCLQGRMLSVLDYKKQFEEMAQTHSTVYYSRHPYLKRGDEEILSYLAGFSNVEITDIPSYRLISNSNVRTVMSVSSSVLVEARYFDKKIITLYKPVIDIVPTKAGKHYASIYQSFVNPNFWSNILSPLMATKESPDITFLSEKDKIRDMLGFYWSYKQLDKLEEIRTAPKSIIVAKSGGTKEVLATKAPVAKSTSNNFIQSEKEFARLVTKMRKVDVISFDVFDTLLERVAARPEDLFKLMDTDALQLTNGSLKNFAEVRRKTRGWALESSLHNGEEVDLDARYAALSERMGLGSDTTNALKNRELYLERDFCKSRFFGKKLFETAKEMNKRVILVSDMYFTKEFIAELLRFNGYAGWSELYVSSTFGKLKRSGSLFGAVLELEAINPKRMLHIGDDHKADFEVPREIGINSCWVPAGMEIFKESNPLHAAWSSISDEMTRSAVLGLTSRNCTSSFIDEVRSHTSGKLQTFGYSVLGPMFFGFAKWILDKALQENIDDLFFLARDGEIVKRCYDAVARTIRGAPRSHYVLASRRAVRVASIRNSRDIISVLETNFTPVQLQELLKSRFGIDGSNIPDVVYREHGFSSGLSVADWKVNQDRLKGFFIDERVSSLIVERASIERDLLSRHYKNHGMDANNRVGFVDIGHSGTLQAGISSIMSLNNTVGFYFTTTKDVDQKLAIGSHKSFGYVGDRLNPSDKSHPYMQNILMFEIVFLNSQNSFLHFRGSDNHIEAVYLESEDDADRKKFSSIIHDEVVRFSDDLIDSYGRYLDQIRITGSEAMLGYISFIKSASKKDAEIFTGLTFENSYSGRSARYILAPLDSLRSSPSLWERGKRVLIDSELDQYRLRGWRFPAHRLITKVVETRSDRHQRKFHRYPQLFFADSKKLFFRRLGLLVYGKPND